MYGIENKATFTIQAGTSSWAVQSHRTIPASSEDSLPFKNATLVGKVIVKSFAFAIGASFLPEHLVYELYPHIIITEKFKN